MAQNSQQTQIFIQKEKKTPKLHIIMGGERAEWWERLGGGIWEKNEFYLQYKLL